MNQFRELNELLEMLEKMETADGVIRLETTPPSAAMSSTPKSGDNGNGSRLGGNVKRGG